MPQRAATILLVEDEYLVGSDLENTLRAEGYEVTFVNSCANAYRELQRREVDAVLLDLYLNHEDCRELVGHLTSIGLPFAFYSALSGHQILREYPALVIDEGSSPEEIRRKLSKLLARARP